MAGTTSQFQPEPSTQEACAGSPCVGGIRLRLLVLIAVTQAIVVWWVADSEIARGIYLVCYSLMMPTVLYLLIVRLLRRWLPLTDNELLIGYIVLTATIPIVGFGGMRFLIEGMGYLPYAAQSQPKLVQFLEGWSRLPVLQDADAVRGLYYGGGEVPWQAWALPIAFWSVYLMLLSGIWLCLAAVLRRVWVDSERLTFPIAMLPLRLMDPRDDIFRRALFWIGFVIPVVLQSLLVINQWVPSVPALRLKAWDVRPDLFPSPPWNAIPSLPVGFYPMAIGLAYFVPSDVSFSCWFLGLAMKLVYVAGTYFGVESAGTGAARFPYREEQAAGAWIAFAGLILWGARQSWRNIARLVPPDELRTVRRLALLAAVLVGLCAAMMTAIGIPGVTAGVVILVYGAYVLTGARVRAEAGAQWTFAPLVWTPHRVSHAVVGTSAMDSGSLVAAGTLNLIHVDIRAQSLPYLMEGLCIAERSGIQWRTVLRWVAIGTVTALALGWFTQLTTFHRLGAATARAEDYGLVKVQISFTEVERLAIAPAIWDRQGVAAMAAAAGITVLLSASRRLGPFGLHPVGYVLSNTLTINSFIVPFFLAWLAKSAALRFGGNRAYRGSVPFFVGVILGDIVIQAAWAIVGAVLEVPIYQFLS